MRPCIDEKYDDNECPEAQTVSKLRMLQKLNDLTKLGVILSQNYTMESDYDDMRKEYDLQKDIMERKNGTKTMKQLLLICVQCLELMNERYNPLDMKLQGWSEQINKIVDDYDDLFNKLYDYFKSIGKQMENKPMANLLLILLVSAYQCHITNSLFTGTNYNTSKN
jgi:hypothetical protein